MRTDLQREGFSLLLTIFSGILFFIALLCLGITLVIHCRSFYHLLAEPLHIISESGMTREVVLRNYDHLIEYCSPFYHGELSFPDFPSSASALSHFAETKGLFSCFSLAVPFCFLAGILIISLKARGQRKKVFTQNFFIEFSRAIRLTAWLCILAPLTCLILFFIDFHKVFYGMHHILFNNNDWIFDAATDPIITILPERYFLCCGIGIIVFLFLAAAGLCRLHNRLSWFVPGNKKQNKLQEIFAVRREFHSARR